MAPKRRKRENKLAVAAAVEDDDSLSTISDVTEGSGFSGEDPFETDNYEAKLLDAIELAQEKSLATRVNALVALKIGSQKRMVTCLLLQHYFTIIEIIQKSLKKGNGAEQIAAVKLAVVVVISLTTHKEAEEVFSSLLPTLTVVLRDPTASPKARKEVAHGLALMALIACPDPVDIPVILNSLYDVFRGSLPKGDGRLANLSDDMLSLHCAALNGVCLLMTSLSASTVFSMAQKMLEELTPVLDTQNTDLGIAVGKALAIIHETAKQHRGDFRWKKQQRIIDRLEEFVSSVECHKHQNKKDRKEQKRSFREIIKTIDEEEFPEETLNVGPRAYQENLVIDSWAVRFQYEALRHALEEGLSNHMSSNTLIRDMFDLGPPQEMQDPHLLPKLMKRTSKQTPEAKARNLQRKMNRDNRYNME